MGLQRRDRRAGPGPQLLGVGPQIADQFHRRRQVGSLTAVAVHIRRESHITEIREHLGALHRVRAQAPSFVHDHNTRALSRCVRIIRKKSAQIEPAVTIVDVFRFQDDSPGSLVGKLSQLGHA